MSSTRSFCSGIAAVLVAVFALPAAAQSFRVQCPRFTVLHPDPAATSTIAAINAAKVSNPGATYASVFPGHIKCQQISGGDGFATMADGTQTYLFAFGPLSGLSNIFKGLPGTVLNTEFNQSNIPHLDAIKAGAPNPDWATPAGTFNGAIGLVPDTSDLGVNSISFAIDPNTDVAITGTGYRAGTGPTATKVVFSGGGGSGAAAHISSVDPTTRAITGIVIDNSGGGYLTPPTVTFTGPGSGAQPVAALGAGSALDGHVDPRLIMDVGVLNGQESAPMIAIDEDDELFLTLTNVGMVMRPDLFEQHTVHFHGYPNASSFYDGVPDASVAINIGGSFTYYYLAPEAGTYNWHCHISPPEHLQMGMVGQLYVRPRQTSAAAGTMLRARLDADNNSLARKCKSNDIFCSVQTPGANSVAQVAGQKYAYDDGDGSTAFDVEYPIQMHGFDPNFHFVGMTFNPESFADNKDKYFLLNGRSYPDTVNTEAMSTQATDGIPRFSQPVRTMINIPLGGKALLRFSDLNVTEYHTLASLGIRMHVVGYNARLLRDQNGTNMDYWTN
jgi:hypothetical protein